MLRRSCAGPAAGHRHSYVVYILHALPLTTASAALLPSLSPRAPLRTTTSSVTVATPHAHAPPSPRPPLHPPRNVPLGGRCSHDWECEPLRLCGAQCCNRHGCVDTDDAQAKMGITQPWAGGCALFTTIETCHAHYVFELADMRPSPVGTPTTRPCFFRDGRGPCVVGTHVDHCPLRFTAVSASYLTSPTGTTASTVSTAANNDSTIATMQRPPSHATTYLRHLNHRWSVSSVHLLRTLARMLTFSLSVANHPIIRTTAIRRARCADVLARTRKLSPSARPRMARHEHAPEALPQAQPRASRRAESRSGPKRVDGTTGRARSSHREKHESNESLCATIMPQLR